MATAKGSKLKGIIYEEATYATAPSAPAALTITGATNATPIAITAVAHGRITGDLVTITGVVGNTAANGTWVITKTGVDTFTLNGSVGNGAYVSGGSAALGLGLQLPLVSTDIGLTRAINKSAVLRGDRNPTKGSLGNKIVAGNIVVEPGHRDICFLMKHLLGSVSTSGAGPYTHVIKVGDLPIGLTFDKYFSDIAQVERYLGLRLNSQSFTITDDGILQCTFACVASTEVDDTAPLDAGPHLYAIQGFAVPKATITEGGSPMTIAKNFQLTISNNLDTSIGRVVGNSGALNDIPEGIMAVDGSFDILFQNVTLLNKAKNETVTSLALTFPIGIYSWVLSLAEVQYEVGEPKVSGPLGIVVPMKYHAEYDADAAASSVVSTHITDLASLSAFPA